MKLSRVNKSFLLGLTIIALSTLSSANELLVTRGFNGAWGQLSGESQGLNLQIIERTDNSRQAIVYWYTYGQDRKTAWYFGIGDVTGNQIDFKLYGSDDVGFLQNHNPGDEPVEVIGTMTMSFNDCDGGMVAFDSTHPEVGNGSFDINRVTQTMNMACTGGLSDDHADMGMSSEQIMQLVPVNGHENASGHARFQDAPGYSQFEVEANDLPDGNYHLFVGGMDRGEFSMTAGFGQLEFSSPQETGKMHLTFDPRGMHIGIHDDLGEVLSSQGNSFMQNQSADSNHDYACDGNGGGHNGGGHNGGNDMGDCMEEGEISQIHMDMNNVGLIAGARGDAEWEMTSSHIGFSVEIEGIPEGEYQLRVGGQAVGNILATEMFGEVAGRIMFRDPQTPMSEHLNFDPRGKVVKVLQQGQVILKIKFPAQ